MYETYYRLKEKPFTLLPDPGFLYLSDKHRMGLTLLEYGLMNQAGFTVISGEIGAGKTTLIRQLLNNMGQEYTIGLITNTHRSFGELLQWILLAYNLDHKDMSKVEMYQRFVDFVIEEYAQNRRVVLIVDEAQNMDAETLEELRMLSNINADKNLTLQVVLSGQRELRDTLRRPDLVQFAQRINVDYHLEALSEAETAGYIRHRLKIAGGDPDTFTPRACAAVHRYSGGVPRLINLLCDTALVYGYADQKRRIDAKLISDVAREKQAGGIFPVIVPAEVSPEDRADEQEAAELAARVDALEAAAAASTAAATTAAPLAESEIPEQGPPEQDMPEAASPAPTKKKLRLVVCAREKSRQYLSELLEDCGFEIVDSFTPDAELIAGLLPQQVEILLIDGLEDRQAHPPALAALLAGWNGPVLYNDPISTRTSQLRNKRAAFGRMLTQRILDRIDRRPITSTVINH
ncbi:MAG: tRNA (adenosine(37)-N6)-threonylcarbamoyltransferase complex ATPase subunit type 1 TsaE [Pseudomonadota bacterium]